MNEESSGAMEEQIMAEENTPLAPKPVITNEAPKKQKRLLDYLRNWFYKLKAPKPISYLILCSLMVIIYTGLLLLSTKQGSQAPKQTSQITTTPSPSPSSDPKVDEIYKEVDEYGKNIDQISATNRKFLPPNVDLDINFTNKK